MRIKILWVMLFTLFFVMPVCAGDLPDYTATVDSEIPGMKLSLDCVIQQPVEKEELKKLADEVYTKYKGKSYKNVFIMWYLPSYKIGNGAWATTNYMDGNFIISIMALQGE